MKLNRIVTVFPYFQQVISLT